MNRESLQEDLVADNDAVRSSAQPSGTRGEGRVVAFKFGGTSMLGAERMLHAAGLVRDAAKTSSVVVVVSAMKGVTDRLLSIGPLLAASHTALARQEASEIVQLHCDVLFGLELVVQDRVRHDLQLLGRDR